MSFKALLTIISEGFSDHFEPMPEEEQESIRAEIQAQKDSIIKKASDDLHKQFSISPSDEYDEDEMIEYIRDALVQGYVTGKPERKVEIFESVLEMNGVDPEWIIDRHYQAFVKQIEDVGESALPELIGLVKQLKLT